VRLLPCNVLARIADVRHQVADFEVELAQRLARRRPLSLGSNRVCTCVTASR
jgi:hypothetical protein